MISMDMIREAHEVVKAAGAVYTPILNIPKIAENLYVKCENLQKTGSFKLRGATYKISKLTDAEKAAGVIAASAGNHAQGVALSATNMGVKSVICMPAGAPLAKVEATKGYGAEVVLVPGAFDDAAAKAVELQKEFGYTFAHPYNDDYVMAGQGTIGLEIMEQAPDADCVIIPIGGGGIAAGIAYAIKNIKPECTVIGVQADEASAMVNSIRSGVLGTTATANTIADGCAVKAPGDKTFAVCKEYLDDVVSVSEEAIAIAMLALAEKGKVVAEGAGAMPTAAVMSGKVDASKYKKIVCMVSGGNVDIGMQQKLFTKALTATGRMAEISTEVSDKAGNLVKLIDLVSGTGANILELNHVRSHMDVNITSCVVRLTIETRDQAHKDEVYALLAANGYRHVK
ncbi:MAG: threonine ammonia-lyase [Oscillospiraceae bacterium]|nr:threonine ammonia-lyase [Oscillospiraceae bacterium]